MYGDAIAARYRDEPDVVGVAVMEVGSAFGFGIFRMPVQLMKRMNVRVGGFGGLLAEFLDVRVDDDLADHVEVALGYVARPVDLVPLAHTVVLWLGLRKA